MKIVRNTFRRNRKLGKLNSLCGLYLLYKLVKIGNLYIGVFIWLGYTSAELKYVCFFVDVLKQIKSDGKIQTFDVYKVQSKPIY